MVHAGARRAAARYLGAHDRRPRPGRHAAAPRITDASDYEVPVGRCIDYLADAQTMSTLSRIAVCGSSLGGYYAARAGCYEHRLAAAAISHGAIWTYPRVSGQTRPKITGSPSTSNGCSARPA